jgi:hypothetical protein
VTDAEPGEDEEVDLTSPVLLAEWMELVDVRSAVDMSIVDVALASKRVIVIVVVRVFVVVTLSARTEGARSATPAATMAEMRIARKGVF